MNPTEDTAPAPSSAPQGVKPHRLIKLGVDVHLREYVVARQIDGAAPQPAQRFTPGLPNGVRLEWRLDKHRVKKRVVFIAAVGKRKHACGGGGG